MQAASTQTEKTWKLPPLILHPFSDASGPGKLVESSRANLMLQGLLPSGDLSADDLDRRLLEGRFCEIRMLYYVGKDVMRWIEQCVDFARRETHLRDSGVEARSFASLLVNDPPKTVREKLRRWGVADYKHIFARALGINAIFVQPPDPLALSPDFVRHYYRFADHVFACYQSLAPFAEIRSRNFDFELFASGEYTRMLERQWEGDSEEIE